MSGIVQVTSGPEKTGLLTAFGDGRGVSFLLADGLVLCGTVRLLEKIKFDDKLLGNHLYPPQFENGDLFVVLEDVYIGDGQKNPGAESGDAYVEYDSQNSAGICRAFSPEVNSQLIGYYYTPAFWRSILTFDPPYPVGE